MSVGVCVLTLNAKKHLFRCLGPLFQAACAPRILVVDSESEDGTAEAALQMGAEVISVARSDFNHGATRELARLHLGTDIVVMLTQDAYLCSPKDLDRLVEPLQDGKCAIAYGRQLPHDNANFYAAFARSFNYPDASYVRSFDDRLRYGASAIFSSNSFCAYTTAMLNHIGGFPRAAVSEDVLVAGRALRAGYRIAYVAASCVQHSHNLTLAEEYRRMQQVAAVRVSFAAEFAVYGSDSSRGRAFTLALLKAAPTWRYPYIFCHVLAKWLGYQKGLRNG